MAHDRITCEGKPGAGGWIGDASSTSRGSIYVRMTLASGARC